MVAGSPVWGISAEALVWWCHEAAMKISGDPWRWTANHQGSFGEPTKYKAPSWPESWEEMNSWMNVIYVMYDPKAPAVFFFGGGGWM